MTMSPQMAAQHARVQALYAAYGTGNRMAFDDLLADDVRLHSVGPADLPWAGLHEGRDAVHAYLQAIEGASTVEGYTPEHAIGDGEWLILLGTLRVRVKGGPGGRGLSEGGRDPLPGREDRGVPRILRHRNRAGPRPGRAALSLSYA